MEKSLLYEYPDRKGSRETGSLSENQLAARENMVLRLLRHDANPCPTAIQKFCNPCLNPTDATVPDPADDAKK